MNMNKYVSVIGGWLIGMLIVIVVKSIYVQRSKKYDCGFWEAVRIYLAKDTGPLVLSVVMLFAGVFLMPYITVTSNMIADGKIPSNDLRAKAVNAIINNMRPWSIFFGIVSQTLGFLVVSKAEKFIRRVDKVIDSKIDDVAPDQDKKDA